MVDSRVQALLPQMIIEMKAQNINTIPEWVQIYQNTLDEIKNIKIIGIIWILYKFNENRKGNYKIE